MSSRSEGDQIPSRPGRIDDGIYSDSCVNQEPLDIADGSIYDYALTLPQRTAVWEGAFPLEGLEGRWVGGVLVLRDHARERRMART